MTTEMAPHPLKAQMDAYGWLVVRLVPIFGMDRIILAKADMGHALCVGVHNGRDGDDLKRHAMWLERGTETGHYSLNELSEERRDTVVRHFIKDCKTALGWDA